MIALADEASGVAPEFNATPDFDFAIDVAATAAPGAMLSNPALNRGLQIVGRLASTTP